MKRSKPERVPQHGDVVTVHYPATTRRRKWCAICSIWTWGTNHPGIFRHPHGTRTRECRTEGRRL